MRIKFELDRDIFTQKLRSQALKMNIGEILEGRVTRSEKKIAHFAYFLFDDFLFCITPKVYHLHEPKRCQ